MPKQIIRWKCNHCRKHFASKRYAEKHEKICFFNLGNRACPTCLHFNYNFNPRLSKCSETGRQNKKESVYFPGEDSPFLIDGFNCFTEFVVYNCEHWRDRFDEIEEK